MHRVSPGSFFLSTFFIAWACALVLGNASAQAQQFHRQSFESNETQLRLGLTNGQVEPLEHQLDERFPHSGRKAERFLLRVTSGDFALIEYPIEPTMIIEELEISAFVSASRPGMQLQARVVLPREVDASTGRPRIMLLSGTTYDTTDRYRKLVVSRLDKLLLRQVGLLQAEEKRDIDQRGAYVDQVVLNVLSGLGEYEIRVDDLVVGPMVPRVGGDELVDDSSPTSPEVPLNLRDSSGQMPHVMVPEITGRDDLLRAEMRSEQLFVGSKAYFPRGMARSDAPLRVFRETGLNMVFEPFPVAETVSSEASSLGLLVVPMMPTLAAVGDRESNARWASSHEAAASYRDVSAFFYLGGPLDETSSKSVEESIRLLRDQDRAGDRPLTGDVSGGLRDYSRSLDMIGTAKFPLISSLELSEYQTWLRQRKTLAVPGTFLWSWIQTHPPQSWVRLAYGHSLEERAFDRPVGPQPQQIRLNTYASLAAGSRGIVFTSDRWLGESAKGASRRLGLAILNAELTLIEPFIAGGNAPIIRPTSHPNIMTATFKHSGGRGTLVIAFWNEPGTQYVVGQASARNVQFIVPSAAESSQAFEIRTSEVQGVKRRRDVGGIRITLDEFDTVAFVVLTTDIQLFANYQEMVQRIAPEAVRWQYELAGIEFDDTLVTEGRLDALGRTEPLSQPRLAEAREELERAKTALDRSDYRLASRASQLSMRSVRELQAIRWRQAVSDSAPPSSVHLASYFTLPEHASAERELASASFSPNQLTTGDFEVTERLDQLGWTYEPRTTDEVSASATLIALSSPGSSQALELLVEPTTNPPPAVLDRTVVRVESPAVPVEAGQWVRIKGRVLIPQSIEGSVDGAMLYDTLGGEALAWRWNSAMDWKTFDAVRPVIEAGEVRLHLVLTGLGRVQFDDLSIETTNGASAVAATPAR